MSMMGKWASWYDEATQPQQYGASDASYVVAETWLQGLDVDDWGCGYAWFKRYHDGGYTGIDGTAGYADVVTDLTRYAEPSPGVLLRHVLEHNHEWAKILDNACTSFTQRMVVVVFTPNGHGEPIGYVPELDVSDYALPYDEIENRLSFEGTVGRYHIPIPTGGYGGETYWLVERR